MILHQGPSDSLIIAYVDTLCEYLKFWYHIVRQKETGREKGKNTLPVTIKGERAPQISPFSSSIRSCTRAYIACSTHQSPHRADTSRAEPLQPVSDNQRNSNALESIES